MIRLSPEARVFVAERHLATLTTVRPDGTPHVVPVAFTWDPEAGVARITTMRRAVKARNIGAALERHGAARVAICQVHGGRWLTLEGTAEIVDDVAEVAEAVRRHAVRYRPLDPEPERVVVRVTVDRIMGSDYMVD